MSPPINTSTMGLAVVIMGVVMSTRWVRINISSSAPRGLYRLSAVQEPLARGVPVVLPMPASVWPCWSAWVPLLKLVAVIAGVHICVSDAMLEISGVSYGPVLHEAHGRPLPRLQSCLTVQEGSVFLASPMAHSLDSRYYDPVPVAAFTAQAVPLLIWR